MCKPLSAMTLQELWQLFPIVLTQHQPYWADWYAQEESDLMQALPAGAVINHIGSTAVPTIWAKPIIDILVEVPTDYKLISLQGLLEQLGYRLMSPSEHRLSFNKGYTEQGFAEKVYHLHLRHLGDHDEIFFRDYLLAHPSIAADYQDLKLRLWKDYEHDRDGYTQAKANFVQKYTEAAKQSLAAHRPLTDAEWITYADVFACLGHQTPDGIHRFVDTRLNKTYDVFLLDGIVLKQCGHDKQQYDQYFAGHDFAVPPILHSFQHGADIWATMPYLAGSDARDCAPDVAACIGSALARIQQHYLTSGGHTPAADAYFQRISTYGDTLRTSFPGYDEAFRIVEHRFFHAPHSLIHDDLLPINVLLSQGRPWIIDWDTSGMLPYFLDLARFAFVRDGAGHFYIPHTSAMAFLDAYHAAMPSLSRPQFLQDVAISAFCQYTIFLHYSDDPVNRRILSQIIDDLLLTKE